LKEDNGQHVQSSLRDSNGIDGIPGVETPGYSQSVPSGQRSANRAKFRQRLECDRLAGAFHLLAMIISAILLMISSASAHAQGGVPLWTNRFFGGSAGMAIDTAGNVVVTGCSCETTNDYVTIKYSNSGVPLWTNRYHRPGNLGDQPAAIAVDGSGNVFVTGSDYATIKYSGLGMPLWTNRYDGPGNTWDAASAIAVDSSGNVFVTGISLSGSDSTSADYATIAYSNTGVPLWTTRYDGANNFDRPLAIAVDASGNVFVTGESYDGGPSPIDFATVAYSNAGAPLWTNRYDGPANLYDRASAIAVDGSGNVFVTGFSENPSNKDYATIAYSNSGVPLWTNRYNPGGLWTSSTAIAVDSSGNVFVTGDSATVAYSNAGVKL
jgi:hypothetical protein